LQKYLQFATVAIIKPTNSFDTKLDIRSGSYSHVTGQHSRATSGAYCWLKTTAKDVGWKELYVNCQATSVESPCYLSQTR